MAGRKTKGSSHSVSKHIRMNPDLLAEIDVAVQEGASPSFSSFMEDGARLKLAEVGRTRTLGTTRKSVSKLAGDDEK